MRKIREVLRLRFELGLGQRAIARACSISQSTVHEYLNRAAAAGVVWPLGEEWDEQRVEQALFGERQVVKRLAKPTLPQLNLHNTRVRRKTERLPSSRCIESAQSHSARVRTLPTRASDTALRLIGNYLT